MPKKRKPDDQDPDAATGAQPTHATAVAPEPEPDPVQEPEAVDEVDESSGENGERSHDSAPEAQVAVTMRGPASAVRKASARFGAAPGPSRQPVAPAEPEDPYVELLSDPRNMVVVTREEPEMVNGQPLRPIKKRINCPTSIDRISDKIFRDYGGHIFRLSIHPNTPNGESKILGALTIENPSTDEPWYPEDVRQQETEAQPLDPTTVVDDDPIVVAEQAMARRGRVLAQKIRVKELDRTLRELDEEGDGGGGRGKKRDGEDSDRLSRAERKLEEASIEMRVGSQISELKQVIQQQNETIQRLASMPQKKDDGNNVFVAMIQAMNAQSTAMLTAMQQSTTQMITAITAASRAPKEDEFEKLLKIKTLLSTEDSRTRRFDSVMEEFMLERLMGGGGDNNIGPDDDAVKLLIKQGIPAFKELMNAKIESDKRLAGPGVTAAQIKEITENAKKTAVNDFFAKLKQEGKMIALPAPGSQPAPAPQPATQAPTAPQEDDVNLPPGPTSKAYDRKLSVNFVLSTIVDDIQKGCPADSFAAGDCLDRLDDDLLVGISQISTGEELETLLSPFAEPAKVAYIKKAGENEQVAAWLRSVVNTVRKEYMDELRKSAEPKK